MIAIWKRLSNTGGLLLQSRAFPPLLEQRSARCRSRFYSVGAEALQNRNLYGKFDPEPDRANNSVVDIDFYNDFKPRADRAKTDLLVKLATCTKESISSDVDIIRIGEGADVGMKSLSPSTLYVRQFYPDLLTEIRKHKRSALIGNPGIGKSFFQFYYLARIVNPDLYGPLPPDCFGSTAPPKIVIRQEGTASMTVFDIANRKADKIQGYPITIFGCFDPKTTLYLMEPGKSIEEPHIESMSVPTLVTASPLLARYKEFCKNGGAKLFMPVFALSELLAIGEFLVSTGRVQGNLVEEYTPAAISERFGLFGGILRHVLPLSPTYLTECLKSRTNAIRKGDAHALLFAFDIEDADVSHHLMQYNVKTTGPDRFRTDTLGFVSPSVVTALQDKLTACSIADKVLALRRNDETGFINEACPKLYEEVIAALLTTGTGVSWQKRYVCVGGTAKGDTDDWTDQDDFKLGGIVYGEPPVFADMKLNTLYVPLKSNFAFVDFMCKVDNNQLVAFQVTRQRKGVKGISPNAQSSFKEKLGLSGPSLPSLRFVLIPSPSVADSAELTFEGDYCLDSYEVWKVPADYGRGRSVVG